MIRTSEPPGDDYLIRCRKLGHEVAFFYCRSESAGLPCSKTIDCWYDHFLVEDLLRRELKPEEWDRVFMAPTRPKMVTLVDLIEQAKRSDKI
ncbi:MAG: hypothetical protein CVU64_07355 [Deltaproteobacteria bacterium HGW-Deltaproteobacteria-21]|jgi:hypothetical protein|nr:MAG: hypothetical protein CVU64_07355 [Deltaproteobacteria bacterium HGW-Deltaproteobacteria-21]